MGKKEASSEKMPPEDWTVGKPVGHFPNCRVDGEGLAIVGGAI